MQQGTKFLIKTKFGGFEKGVEVVATGLLRTGGTAQVQDSTGKRAFVPASKLISLEGQVIAVPEPNTNLELPSTSPFDSLVEPLEHYQEEEEEVKATPQSEIETAINEGSYGETPETPEAGEVINDLKDNLLPLVDTVPMEEVQAAKDLVDAQSSVLKPKQDPFGTRTISGDIITPVEEEVWVDDSPADIPDPAETTPKPEKEVDPPKNAPERKNEVSVEPDNNTHTNPLLSLASQLLAGRKLKIEISLS